MGAKGPENRAKITLIQKVRTQTTLRYRVLAKLNLFLGIMVYF
jgi:hypothetical protein